MNAMERKYKNRQSKKIHLSGWCLNGIAQNTLKKLFGKSGLKPIIKLIWFCSNFSIRERLKKLYKKKRA